jgi:hypothetical protein
VKKRKAKSFRFSTRFSWQKDLKQKWQQASKKIGDITCVEKAVEAIKKRAIVASFEACKT